jgi:hypothetical protein
MDRKLRDMTKQPIIGLRSKVWGKMAGAGIGASVIVMVCATRSVVCLYPANACRSKLEHPVLERRVLAFGLRRVQPCSSLRSEMSSQKTVFHVKCWMPLSQARISTYAAIHEAGIACLIFKSEAKKLQSYRLYRSRTLLVNFSRPDGNNRLPRLCEQSQIGRLSSVLGRYTICTAQPNATNQHNAAPPLSNPPTQHIYIPLLH